MQQGEVAGPGPIHTEGWVLAGPPAVPESIAARPALLGLVEDMLLASLSEGGYAIPPRRQLAAGLAAASIVELALRERVAVDGARLLVTDREPTGDSIVDPVLDALAARRKAPEVERCLEQLALDWTILGRAGGRLEARGLVRIERRALHPLIMHRFHPLPPGRPAERRARLRRVLGGGWDVSPWDAAPAVLAGAVGVLQMGREWAFDLSRELEGACRAIGRPAAGELLGAVALALTSSTGRRRSEQASHA